jgi:hypothetical protein
MSAILNLNINFDDENQLNMILNDKNSQGIEQEMELDLSLASNSDNTNLKFNDNWKILAQSQIKKKFVCLKSNIYSIDCDLVQLFELGSVYHEYYLINLKFKENSQFLNKLTASQIQSTILPDVRVMITVSLFKINFKRRNVGLKI